MRANPMAGIYKVLQVGVHQPPMRFAVEVGQVQYRLFSYFPVGQDGSIAVHSYYKATHTFAETVRTPPQEMTPEERERNVSAAKDAAVPFVPEKHTFHQSGVLNMKNRLGKRLSGQDDVRSIPFNTIDKVIRLGYIYPAPYHRYPTVDPREGKHHNVFRLVGDVSTMPSMIELLLYKREYDVVARVTELYPGFAAFMDTDTLNALDLAMLTVFRQSPNSQFLSTHAFVKEFY